MGCGIGMATDVAARKPAEGRGQGSAMGCLVCSGIRPDPGRGECDGEGLATECGPHCEGQPEGGFESGRAWSVYRIDW